MIITDGLIKTGDKSNVKSDYQKWRGRNIDKNITGKFRIRKSIHGKLVYFGTYDNFDDAISVRDMLVENGWNKKELPRIKEKICGV